MNIIFIKQAVKAKVNKQDLKKAITPVLERLLNDDNIDIKVINTSDIDGVSAGGTVLLASNERLTDYIAISIGASTKDILCITDDGNDNIYNFEYVLNIDSKVFRGQKISEALANIKSNKELSEALRMIGIIATGARYDTLISGRYGEVESKLENRYKGILVVDYKDKEHNDINLDVIGRKGKTHLLRIVPVLNEEMKIVKYINDNVMCELIALDMVDAKASEFSLRENNHNFTNVLPVNTLTEDEINMLNIPKDKKGNLVIDNLDTISRFMDLKFS